MAVLDALNFTQGQLTDFAILSGNDYIENIGSLGPVTAHKLMSKFGSLEEILKVWKTKSDADPIKFKKDDPRAHDLISIDTQYQKIREMYLPPKNVEFVIHERKIVDADRKGLQEFLSQYNFSENRAGNVDKRIEALLNPQISKDSRDTEVTEKKKKPASKRKPRA